LEEIEITPSGYGIHFPKLDADLYLPALLQGFTGSRKWMASGAREGWGSVAKPGESGGGEEEWKVGGTAEGEGEVKRVGRRLDRQTTP